MTKDQLAIENAALRTTVSQLSADLLNANTRVRRLHIIIGNRYSAAKQPVWRPEHGGALTRDQAAIISRATGRTVQEIMREGA
jgi:hypothetical protein